MSKAVYSLSGVGEPAIWLRAWRDRPAGSDFSGPHCPGSALNPGATPDSPRWRAAE